MTNLAPLMSSDNPNWETPDVVLDLVRELAGGTIDLDPCSTAENPTEARRWFTPAKDGITQDWKSNGLTYVNAPYGTGLVGWVGKAVKSYRFGDARSVLLLLPGRPDTRWWQDYCRYADAICFWKGRLTFKGAPGPAPFPSALWFMGPHRDKFRDVFAPRGWVVTP